MNWREAVISNAGAWRAVCEYAQERVEMHTATCKSTASSDLAIRQSQAAIQELERLIDLPKTLANEAMARSGGVKRKEY